MTPTPTILLVEDDQSVRLMVRWFLEQRGFALLEADTVAKAMGFVRSPGFHILLLDLGLPDGDGFAVARELRRRPGTDHIRIALFTAQSLTGRRAAILGSLCDAIIPKPVALERLERDIRLLLSLPRRGAVRRFPRVPLEVPVWYRLSDQAARGPGRFAVGQTRTVSEGGVRVTLPTQCAAATRLEVELHLPGGPVPGTADVVWSAAHEGGPGQAPRYEHGLAFVEVGAAACSALQEALEAEYR